VSGVAVISYLLANAPRDGHGADHEHLRGRRAEGLPAAAHHRARRSAARERNGRMGEASAPHDRARAGDGRSRRAYPQQKQLLELVRAACVIARAVNGVDVLVDPARMGEGPDDDDEWPEDTPSRDFFVKWRR
jgi:hypothetical protein